MAYHPWSLQALQEPKIILYTIHEILEDIDGFKKIILLSKSELG